MKYVKTLSIGLLLFVVAIFLLPIMTAVNFLVVRSPYYFRDTALALDKFANSEYRSSLNKYLIMPDGYKFGHPNETMSSVLGKNTVSDKRLPKGIKLCAILDWLDTNHCIKSIDENCNVNEYYGVK